MGQLESSVATVTTKLFITYVTHHCLQGRCALRDVLSTPPNITMLDAMGESGKWTSESGQAHGFP